MQGGDLYSNGGWTEWSVLRGWNLSIIGVVPTLVRQGLAVSSPEHLEGETSLGIVREVAVEGGSGTNDLRKVLPRGGPCSDTLWVRNQGVDSSNAAKT